MNIKISVLVKKVQEVNNLTFEKVAESIGFTNENLKYEMDKNDYNNKIIDLLFLKHPNSLRDIQKK
jgi:hypothetical protein